MFLQNWNNHFYKDQRKSKLISYLLLLHLKGLKPENKCLRKISKKIKISQNKITCNIKTNPPLWSRAEKQSTDWRLGHRWRDLCGMTESLSLRGPVHCLGLGGESDDEMSWDYYSTISIVNIHLCQRYTDCRTIHFKGLCKTDVADGANQRTLLQSQPE